MKRTTSTVHREQLKKHRESYLIFFYSKIFL